MSNILQERSESSVSQGESEGNILQEIAESTRKRIAAEKEKDAPEEVHRQARERAAAETASKGDHRFLRALRTPGMSYICEVKKASPSKGLIAPDFPYLDIAREYEAAGAAAISCLTEPERFLGSNVYLREIAETVSIPVLKKDFTVDPYMIYQAARDGASAVLLICAILTDEELREYRLLAEELGMDALVEAHDETEVKRAADSGARIIGVNNRDLKTFQVDTANSIKLRPLVSADTVFVSESGIKTHADIEVLKDGGVDAVLIGETLMRSADKAAALRELNGGTPGAV